MTDHHDTTARTIVALLIRRKRAAARRATRTAKLGNEIAAHVAQIEAITAHNAAEVARRVLYHGISSI